MCDTGHLHTRKIAIYKNSGVKEGEGRMLEGAYFRELTVYRTGCIPLLNIEFRSNCEQHYKMSQQ